MNNTRLQVSIILAAVILSAAFVYKGGTPRSAVNVPEDKALATVNPAKVMVMGAGNLLPAQMEEMMAQKLVEIGAIDPAKLPQATELNLLWSFGLANKNAILEKGPIMDPRYGGPQNMASVGGWTAAKGNVMDHYSMHELMMLTPDQQSLVEKVSKGVFRPCCKNSTYFPDCNHGMAMLGLLEILAAQGASEQELHAAAEKANSIWFPGQQQAGCGLESVPAPAQSAGCGLQ